MCLSTVHLAEILGKLDSYGSTPADLIITLLEGVVDHVDYRDNILQNADKIFASLARNPPTSVDAIRWAHETTMRTYADQMRALVQVKTGLRFSAKHCTAQSLSDFDIMGVAKQMEVKAPHLWELLGVLLAADSSANAFRESRGKQR